MWNLFKKEKSKKLVAPVDGKLIPLSQVKDEAFASGALGTGYAVMFDGNKVVAPADGTIEACFPTGHAVGIKTSFSEIIVHIGIDTVQMEGKGFHVLVKTGDVVKTSDVIVEVDSDVIKECGFDPVTMVLLTEGKDIKLESENQIVKAGDEVAKCLD